MNRIKNSRKYKRMEEHELEEKRMNKESNRNLWYIFYIRTRIPPTKKHKIKY